VYYSKLEPKGKLNNLESVKKEVELMMDPNADPFAAPAEPQGEPERFGAKDVFDLNWVQLMNAYSCTECGRCTSACPANITGKKLSPRKIMMDTRDRLEEVGKNIDANGGEFKDDGKSLLRDYITEEEILACTTCNACAEECPVNIDPVSIIIDLRRYLIMEESKAPQEWTMMLTNIENNGAPWQFAQADRLNWKNEA
jgi:Fe-S oxidoreductase